MATETTGQQERTGYVIAGGGPAAAKAVEGIRESDKQGSILLVAEEDRLPYERPPLSKGVLKGDDEPDSAFTHDRDWYDEQNVELRLGSAATSLDAADHTLTLADGDTLVYEKLLLATGSSARALDVPGADLEGVLYLRELQESEALKARLSKDARVVIVGAGWIGLEVAAAAAEAGASVTVIEPQAAPLLGVMGEK